MTDVAVYLPVPELGGLPSPLKAWRSWRLQRREKYVRRWVTELNKHARATRYARESAELLEGVQPGSVVELDAKRVNIPASDDCALGQVYGSYHVAPAELKLSVHAVGFNVPRDMEARHMNLAWRRVIYEYREALA